MECPKCCEENTEDDFSWRNKKKGIRQLYCKSCMKKLNAAHYLRNKERYKKNNRKIIAANREFVWEFLAKNPCVDCGEPDPLVLEFDHLDRNTKTGGISRLMRDSCSLATLQREIAKCEVRCANCHRRRTASQLGWWLDKRVEDRPVV